MNNTTIISTDVKKWLKNTGYSYQKITKVSDGASFRSYFRLHQVKNSQKQVNPNLILKISPKDKENNSKFINVLTQLHHNQIHTLEIIEYLENPGYFLITDLGEHSLFDLYQNNYFESRTLDYYFDALNILDIFNQQSINLCKKLPFYQKNIVMSEVELFDQWFINKLLASIDKKISHQWKKIKQEIFDLVEYQFSNLPQIFTHRDFHSKNLMIQDHKRLAVVDFQDAIIGPVGYDLISLLKDSYVQLPESIHQLFNKKGYQIYQSYFSNYNDFLVANNFISIQRHLKVIGIFSRLNLRDNKSNYLESIPLTLHYLTNEVAICPELRHFYYFLKNQVMPAWHQFSIKKNINQ